jgi:5-methylcytosine-specific restriction protein A
MAHWVDLGRDGVPTEGGERPQLVVTIGLDQLISGLGYGAMGPDQLPFSVSEARRLACDCSIVPIVPIVLSADSVPLDVGRASRTIPVNIRRAVVNRDKGCAFPGCDKPGSWCQVHHIVEWQHGGPTKPENLALLCRQHHRLIHHSEWEVRMANGYPEFIPPGWLDGPRTPRTNPFHRPPNAA